VGLQGECLAGREVIHKKAGRTQGLLATTKQKIKFKQKLLRNFIEKNIFEVRRIPVGDKR